jgi:hypothetical protein
MVTDAAGAEYYQKLGLAHIWDVGITASLDVLDSEALLFPLSFRAGRFIMDGNYQFPAEWDWTALPCNTALLYIADEQFKEYYTSESIGFMRNLRETKNITAEMVFAEQRLLAMCAAAKGIKVKTLLNADNLDNQNAFTHVWGLKRELHTNLKKRRDFCLNCVERIISDFPEETLVLEKIESLKPYMKKE